MVLLSIAIVFALLITIVLPIVAGIWINKKHGVSWRIISYGALAYFIVQALITLLLSGVNALVENGALVLTDQRYGILQIFLSIAFAALLGVIVRWAGMKYLKDDLQTLNAAYGIGIGYGGVESIMLVGIPLLMTFITMISNLNLEAAAAALEPDVVAQLEILWGIPAYVPLAGSLERLSALVMHITVTVVILQAFIKDKILYLAAAFGVELLVNGLVVGLAEMGLPYGWVILISAVLMAGNIYLLYRLKAFEFIENPKDVSA